MLWLTINFEAAVVIANRKNLYYATLMTQCKGHASENELHVNHIGMTEHIQ